MTRVIGVDPGTGSWDFFGLDDDEVILDTSIPTRRMVQNPGVFLDVINSVEGVDLLMAPSGFGLPLKRVQDITGEDIALTMVKKDRQKKIVGLREILEVLKKLEIPGYVIPGVKHLPTVPTYRKVNKIDMGTADKVCTAAVGIRDQSERMGIPFDETSFIMVEVGTGFSAVLAIEDGRVVDGIGGTNVMGFQACGGLDGELAYLLGEVHKSTIYRGGVASIAGSEALSPQELVLLACKDPQTKLALDAFLEDLVKAIFSIQIAFREGEGPREILVAGRGAQWGDILGKISKKTRSIAPCREMGTYAQIAKRAAQGSAFIANGLVEGGKFTPLVENLGIRNSSGSVLDHIHIPHEGPFL
ncbi:MAG: DUF1464 family protein [Promethearchaeota archaeon]